MIALARKSLYLCAFGSASVSPFTFCQATRARRGFQPALNLIGHPFRQFIFSVGEIGNKWLLNLSLVFFPAI